MAKNENPTPAASGAGASETNIINKELSAALARVHHRLRPWHVYGVLGVCIVAAVLSAVLVHVRDQQRSDALIQSQVNVSLLMQLLEIHLFLF
jgi:transcription antitermination factor NusA-like protein